MQSKGSYVIIVILQKQLEDESLSFEDRKYIIDKMLEITRMIGEKTQKIKDLLQLWRCLVQLPVSLRQSCHQCWVAIPRLKQMTMS